MPRFRYSRERDCIVNPDGSHTDYFWDKRNEFIPAAPMVISDVEEYRTAAGDVAHSGKRVRISSRSRHREFLRDNRLVEIGNDLNTPQLMNNGVRKETKAQFLAAQKKRVEHIKKAIDWVKTDRVAEHLDNRPETLKDHFNGT